MNTLDYQHFYLVGIKGVAMTSLAQCLLDAGKTVSGSDVAEAFVTQHMLDRLNIKIDIGFEGEIPSDIDCVVYTAAHQSQQNPQVLQAQQKNIATFSHAEALASLFNQKKGIAVCGVGGKSTTAAMIAWIMEKTGQNPSFSVGVGNIPGLEKTGQWHADSQFFVAEADEYVVDPAATETVARFSFLKPFITVCTNLRFDHPDVYHDFEQTKRTFGDFFSQIQDGGFLVANIEDQQSIEQTTTKLAQVSVSYFGATSSAKLLLTDYQSTDGKTLATF